jgi:predicted NBD/HSP70 family sugar kinase
MATKQAIVSVDEMTIEQHDALFVITELIRSGRANTRSDLGRLSGLGRSIVSQRVDDAISLGLVEEAEFGVSSGGRIPRTLRFRHEIGSYLIVMFDTPNMVMAVTDLAGRVLASARRDWDFSEDPGIVLKRIPELYKKLLSEHALPPIWGTVVGVPGPVEYTTGKMQASMLAGWNGYDIRGFMSATFNAPAWVDNDVNLIGLGEYSMLRGTADDPGTDNMLFVEVGIGVGAGIISDGKVHRGANGTAGDIGHIQAHENETILCRCGQLGCLSAVAGGWGLALQGEQASKDGRSPYLQDVMSKKGFLNHMDIRSGALAGDAYCLESVARSGRIVGETLAGLVNFFNPGLIVVGGAIASTGDVFLAAVRQSIYRRALPLATRDLRVIASDPKHEEGLVGGAALAQIETFTRAHMNEWIERRLQEKSGE